MEKSKTVLKVALNLKYLMKVLRKEESPVSLSRALPEADTPGASL